MQKFKLLALLLLLITTSSCSRYVIVHFDSYPPDIAPSDSGFFNNAKSLYIKSANQVTVSNAGDLSNSVNVLISTVEKQLSTYPNKKENSDIIIEVISIEDAPYITDKLYKRNGKKKRYFGKCVFSGEGFNVYLKVYRKGMDRPLNITVYYPPMDYAGILDRECTIRKRIEGAKTQKGYSVGFIKTPPEQLGEQIASYLKQQLK